MNENLLDKLLMEIRENRRYFIDSEFKELFSFKSFEIETELEKRINIITTSLKEKPIYKLNYDDLLYYERGIETMPAYYGNRWNSECFFSFYTKSEPKYNVDFRTNNISIF